MRYVIYWKHPNSENWMEEKSFATRKGAEMYKRRYFGDPNKIHGVPVRVRIVKRKGKPDF